MKIVPIVAVVALAFVSRSAMAQERATDAALGAVSGAVVLGPIGAVAGAAVGYAAGPSIARSWGLRGHRSARHRQPPRATANRAISSAPAPARAAAENNGRVAEISPANSAPPPAAPSPPKPTSTPPVQGFE